MLACYQSPMSTITFTIHSSNQIFLRSTTLPRTSIPQTTESRLFNLLSLHLIRSLNGSSMTWRAVPQQPQKMLVAKLRLRNHKESEVQALLLMSPGADTAYLGTKQEAPHEQKQEVPSETPVRAHQRNAFGNSCNCSYRLIALQSQVSCHCSKYFWNPSF